jgi:hypothetical protein
VKRAASRAFWLVAYPSYSHGMGFDAHACAFVVFGGVPRRGIYDNLKTSGDAVGHGPHSWTRALSPQQRTLELLRSPAVLLKRQREELGSRSQSGQGSRPLRRCRRCRHLRCMSIPVLIAEA